MVKAHNLLPNQLSHSYSYSHSKVISNNKCWDFDNYGLPLSQKPIEILSVLGVYNPSSPRGPVTEINLKNVATEPVISLTALLGTPNPFNKPYIFDFDVSGSNPLLPGQTVYKEQALNVGKLIAKIFCYPF